MSAAREPRRLAAIMFTDMVAYSALCQRDERLANQLLEEHRRMVRAALAETGGHEVDTTGDGFLLEFGSALQAVQCAILLQQRQAQRNAAADETHRFNFRVGIHLGEIETRERNIVGDGVNIAARVEPLSPHGGVAISGAVLILVRNRITAAFRSIGTPSLKNITEPIEVFVLDADAVSAVSLPRPEAARPTARGFLARPRLVIATLVVLGVLAGLGMFAGLQLHLPGTLHDAGEKSIAVLPFSNFSDDKANEYFADGMHDNLLTLLARVKDLKVISRTSVMQYKEGSRNLRQIGKALGVANIVEGSVQKVGNRVRVQAQLIEAATDRHLWADSYDRDLSDVFAIQSDVAQQIVSAVQATLTPQEKQSIERKPTANADAYDLFLRSRELANTPGNPSREALYRGQSMLEKAIALDPDFAAAYCALARVHDTAYWFGLDTTPQRLELSRKYAGTALRLRPDLADGHIAMGAYYLHGFRDYDQAMAEFNTALALEPNAADTHALIGYTQRRRGNFEASIASQLRATELDPRNANIWVELGDTYARLRQFDRASMPYQKTQTLVPDDPAGPLRVAGVQFLWHDDLKPMEQALAAIPHDIDSAYAASITRIEFATLQGRYADAAALLEAFPPEAFTPGFTNLQVPRDFFLGRAYDLSNAPAKARAHLQSARDFLRNYLRHAEADGPYVAEAHAWLGLTEAYLGERDQALRDADEAAQLLPPARDAMDGPPIAELVAKTHARAGDAQGALERLQTLLDMPAGAQAYYVKHDADWKPLWGDARFQQLIADHVPDRSTASR